MHNACQEYVNWIVDRGKLFKTLEPEEVPSSKDGGPFAFTIELRWCAVESLAKAGKLHSFICNHITVKNVAMKNSHHHFEKVNTFKDTTTK